jgi:hypothetical protein
VRGSWRASQTRDAGRSRPHVGDRRGAAGISAYSGWWKENQGKSGVGISPWDIFFFFISLKNFADIFESRFLALYTGRHAIRLHISF